MFAVGFEWMSASRAGASAPEPGPGASSEQGVGFYVWQFLPEIPSLAQSGVLREDMGWPRGAPCFSLCASQESTCPPTSPPETSFLSEQKEGICISVSGQSMEVKHPEP